MRDDDLAFVARGVLCCLDVFDRLRGDIHALQPEGRVGAPDRDGSGECLDIRRDRGVVLAVELGDESAIAWHITANFFEQRPLRRVTIAQGKMR